MSTGPSGSFASVGGWASTPPADPRQDDRERRPGAEPAVDPTGRRACRRSSGRSPARGRCRCRAPRWRASRGRTARRSAAAPLASIPTPVSRDLDPRAVVGRLRRSTSTVAAARRELDRVADEVRDDLADPLRVVADPDRRSGGRCSDRATPRRRGRGRACSTADSTAARRSSGRRSSSTRPESSFESSSRFWASQSSRSSWTGGSTRGTRRGRRVVAGLLGEQLVEREQGGDRGAQLVRDVGQEVPAPVAVAPDDLDALLEPVGHRVELDGELGQLGRAARERGRAARGCVRSPSARAREASVSRRSGVVNRRARQRRDDQRDDRARRAPTAASRLVTLAIAVGPERVRVRQADLDRVRVRAAPSRRRDRRGRRSAPAAWPVRAGRSAAGPGTSPFGAGTTDRSASGDGQARADRRRRPGRGGRR